MSAIINDIEKYITNIREKKVKAAAKAGDAAKAGEPGERYTDIVKILEKCETELTNHKDTFNKRLEGEDLNKLLKVDANKVLFYKKLNEYTKDEFTKIPYNPDYNDITELVDLQTAIKSDYDAFIESLGEFVS